MALWPSGKRSSAATRRLHTASIIRFAPWSPFSFRRASTAFSPSKSTCSSSEDYFRRPDGASPITGSSMLKRRLRSIGCSTSYKRSCALRVKVFVEPNAIPERINDLHALRLPRRDLDTRPEVFVLFADQFCVQRLDPRHSHEDRGARASVADVLG